MTTVKATIAIDGISHSIEIETDNPTNLQNALNEFFQQRLGPLGVTIGQTATMGNTPAMQHVIYPTGGAGEPMQAAADITGLAALIAAANIPGAPVFIANDPLMDLNIAFAPAPGPLPISNENALGAINLNHQILFAFPEFLSDGLNENDGLTVHYDGALQEYPYEYTFLNLAGQNETITGSAQIRAGMAFANGQHLGFTVHTDGASPSSLRITPWTWNGETVTHDAINTAIYDISPDAYTGNLATSAEIKVTARSIIEHLKSVCSTLGSNAPIASTEIMADIINNMISQELNAIATDNDEVFADMYAPTNESQNEMALAPQPGVAQVDPTVVATIAETMVNALAQQEQVVEQAEAVDFVENLHEDDNHTLSAPAAPAPIQVVPAPLGIEVTDTMAPISVPVPGGSIIPLVDEVNDGYGAPLTPPVINNDTTDGPG
jgi:D-ribose pyranose/furanose isomerase RbsD